MQVLLQQVSSDELHDIANACPSPALLARAAEDALPPPFVAERSLQQIAFGQARFCCMTFHIARAVDGFILGGCGFKGERLDGMVEIGYGVSPEFRGQGVASTAVRQLLQLAFAQETVTAVFAMVNQSNIASTGLVSKLGFEKGASSLDSDGEPMTHWFARSPGTVKTLTLAGTPE